jgi:hypothetical protein
MGYKLWTLEFCTKYFTLNEHTWRKIWEPKVEEKTNTNKAIQGKTKKRKTLTINENLDDLWIHVPKLTCD